MTLTLGEVFEKAKKLPNNTERSAWLRKHAGPGMYYLLKIAFQDPTWLLPEGAPPFKRDVGADKGAGLTPSHLLRELRTFYLFFQGGNPGLNQLRREKLFQGVLERLDNQEIALVLSLKDKSFTKDYRVTRNLVDQTFPGLLQTPFTTKFLRG